MSYTCTCGRVLTPRPDGSIPLHAVERKSGGLCRATVTPGAEVGGSEARQDNEPPTSGYDSAHGQSNVLIKSPDTSAPDGPLGVKGASVLAAYKQAVEDMSPFAEKASPEITNAAARVRDGILHARENRYPHGWYFYIDSDDVLALAERLA